MTQGSKLNRKGTVIWWMMGTMITLCMIISLAVDLGRVHLAKTELRAVADAIARAGASGMDDGLTVAVSRSQSIARANKVDGAAFDVNTVSDIQFGVWNISSRSFTPVSAAQFSSANAIRVTANKNATQNGPVKLLFASVLGKSTQNLSAEAIVRYVPGINVDHGAPGTANPFLSGMPPGSIASVNNPHNSPDYAGNTSNPRQSPLAVSIALTEGMALTFDNIDGTVRHDPNLPYFNPDGELTDIGRNTAGSENGIADVTAPINCLVGVFLSDSQPNLTSAPRSLNFSTAASRDFDTLRPELKQIFFIGDGRNSNNEHQSFIVPRGATRLFLATWDFFEWNNNAGSRTVKVNRPEAMILVK